MLWCTLPVQELHKPLFLMELHFAGHSGQKRPLFLFLKLNINCSSDCKGLVTIMPKHLMIFWYNKFRLVWNCTKATELKDRRPGEVSYFDSWPWKFDLDVCVTNALYFVLNTGILALHKYFVRWCYWMFWRFPRESNCISLSVLIMYCSLVLGQHQWIVIQKYLFDLCVLQWTFSVELLEIPWRCTSIWVMCPAVL